MKRKTNKLLYVVLFFFTVNFLTAQPGDSIKTGRSPAADKKIANFIFQSDSINIGVRIRGCFTGYTTTISIYRSGKTIQLNYKKGGEANELHMLISKRQLHRIKRLFYSGIDLPRNRAMCTTKITFTATARGTKVQFIDGRCSDTDDLAAQLDKILKIPPEE